MFAFTAWLFKHEQRNQVSNVTPVRMVRQQSDGMTQMGPALFQTAESAKEFNVNV